MLTQEQYQVLREKGTERPFTGALTQNHETGNYHCAGCGALLFMSGAKFDSGCGWPSFMLPADSKAVAEHEDRSFGMRRVEVTCARCGGHLGHVFPDGPRPPGCATASTRLRLTFERREAVRRSAGDIQAQQNPVRAGNGVFVSDPDVQACYGQFGRPSSQVVLRGDAGGLSLTPWRSCRS